MAVIKYHDSGASDSHLTTQHIMDRRRDFPCGGVGSLVIRGTVPKIEKVYMDKPVNSQLLASGLFTTKM